jgi:hypothetical protein
MDLELIRPKIGIEGRCTTIPVVAIAWQSAMQAAVSRRHESRLVRHQADVGAGFGKREPAQKALNFLSIGRIAAAIDHRFADVSATLSAPPGIGAPRRIAARITPPQPRSR